MSRPSPFKHPLAVLRAILGMSQEELGIEIKLSRRTVQAIELGNLRLTEENALKIEKATGVAMDWLLAGDVNNEPYYDDGVERRRYSREIYEQIKGSEWESVRPEETPSELHIGALATTTNWLPILAAAEKSGKSAIAVYHMRKFLDEMREKFGFDEETASQIWGKTKVIEPDGKELVFTSDGMTYVKGGRGIKLRRKSKAESPKNP